MAKKMKTLSYRYPGGGLYKFQYRLAYDSEGRGYYQVRALDHPSCNYPLGVPAHLLTADLICVAQGREPRTIERAKAVAFCWMTGFESYRRTGVFPDNAVRFDIKEV